VPSKPQNNSFSKPYPIVAFGDDLLLLFQSDSDQVALIVDDGDVAAGRLAAVVLVHQQVTEVGAMEVLVAEAGLDIELACLDRVRGIGRDRARNDHRPLPRPPRRLGRYEPSPRCPLPLAAVKPLERVIERPAL
jgi:hypothetical protein